MLLEGFTVMFIGMFSVFLFLGLLVLMMKAVSFFLYDEQALALEHSANSILGKNDQDNEEVAVVLAIAKSYLQGKKS